MVLRLQRIRPELTLQKGDPGEVGPGIGNPCGRRPRASRVRRVTDPLYFIVDRPCAAQQRLPLASGLLDGAKSGEFGYRKSRALPAHERRPDAALQQAEADEGNSLARGSVDTGVAAA